MDASKTDDKSMAIEPIIHDDTPIKEGKIVLNVSGHAQELDRSFGFWSIVNLGIGADNAWGAGAGALVTCLYNGGGPGVMYELVVATIFYISIAASLAELSSAIPSSANVYHWASVTGGPKWGRVLSFYAGWWNYLAYLTGACSACLIAGNTAVSLYYLHNPGFEPQRWHTYIAYLLIAWSTAAIVLFGQRVLPVFTTFVGLFCLSTWFITLVVCAVMPSQTGARYASNSFVWTDWSNQTGWSSNGLVFLMGMLNGAYTIGTPNAVCHLSEEVPDPKRNVPKGIVAQLSTGFITSFLLYISLLYAITDLDKVANSPFTSLPLVAIYQQVTNYSTAGTTGLLIIFFLNDFLTVVFGFVILGRMLWTLARDRASPCSNWLGKINPTFKNPFNATLTTAILVALLGLIYLGSAQAFNALVGSFVIFTTMSYLASILPHLLSGRRYIIAGPFYMRGWVGTVTLTVACTYIIVFNVLYCFPFVMPVVAGNMNYASLMAGGSTILLTIGYLWLRTHGYKGPTVILDAADDVLKGKVLTGEELERDRQGRLAEAAAVRTTGSEV